MEETLINIFTHPLVIGLCIGLIVALIIWFRSLGKLRMERSAAAAQADRLNHEIETLKRHLHTQMEITAKGNESLKEELTASQQTNQNLSQAIGALKQKPGRVEIRTLHLYEKAIRMMNARAPGFSSAWENAIDEAEAEIKKEESGLIGWIRKPFMFRKTGSTELMGHVEKSAE
ncbi:hypothetical protein ACWPKO_14820 [Coraliomargarita sp. W4R53]